MCGYTRTQQHGGTGGGEFADNLTETCQLVGVNIRHGSRVDAIQGVWTTPSGAHVTGALHGGGGGELTSFSLAAGEYIVRIDGRSGARTDSLQFTTNTGKTYGPYGGSGGSAYSISDLKVAGFFGRSGSEVDAIGFFTPANC
jgi:hypothetical protein